MAKKNQLPATLPRYGVKRFRKLLDASIPQQYKGTVSGIAIRKAYDEYEQADYAGITLSEIYDKYRLFNKKYWNDQNKKAEQGESEQEEHSDFTSLKQENQQSVSPHALAPREQNSLQKLLQRNYMEEHRKKTGLNHLREELKSKLLEYITLERGLENIAKYAERTRKKDKDPLILMAAERFDYCDFPEDINDLYPDITDKEVTWMSMAALGKKKWLYDFDAPFYFPVSLVNIDKDGLQFSFGTHTYRRDNSIHAKTHFDIGGITGAPSEGQLIRFHPNVTEILNAIIVLSIDDGDLFKRVWESTHVIPMLRGDIQLVKSFLNKRKDKYNISADLDNTRLETLLGKQIIDREMLDDARKSFVSYYNSLTLDSDYVHEISSFVKLIGMLERLPNFIADEDQFKGYIKPYGPNIDFISETGKIVDTVPLAGHLIHELSYDFNDHMRSASKKNNVMVRLIDDLKTQVDNRESVEKVMMMDFMQEHIFEKYGLFIPTDTRVKKRMFSPCEMVIKGALDQEVYEQTVKFSFGELMMIVDVLEAAPEGITQHVRSVFKEFSDRASLYSFKTGKTAAGRYYHEENKIVLSLPFDTPPTLDEYALAVKLATGKEKSKKSLKELLQTINEHEAYFKHVFLHELGESIWANLHPDLRKEWCKLHTAGKDEKNSSRFLTSYATSKDSEDFCETFAIYYNHGMHFKLLGDEFPIILDKYNYMQQIWSMDGKDREFMTNVEVSMYSYLGHPDTTFEEQYIEDEKRVDKMMDDDNEDIILSRQMFANKAYSYETLTEMIEKHQETSADPVEAAALEQFKQSQLELQQLEEESRIGRVVRLVNRKSEEILYDLDKNLGFVLSDLYYSLRNRDMENALKVLTDHGAKKTSAKKAVSKLMKLYKYFEGELDESAIDPNVLDKESFDSGVKFKVAMLEARNKERREISMQHVRDKIKQIEQSEQTKKQNKPNKKKK